MKKQVIHLYGASGSGTSTLGRYIAQKLNGKFMDTDDYFWLSTNPPYTTKRSVSGRLAMMREDIASTDNAVISGSLTDWGDELIPLFTLAVRLETDTTVRIERLRKRERKQFGNRIDYGGDMYEIHEKFIAWASAYDTGGMDMRSKAKHDAWEKLLLCPVVSLDGARSLIENYQIIEGYIKEKAV